MLQGRASDTLLDSYSAERKHAAQENIRQARRSSRFVHPGPAESARMWRDAIIALAPRHDVPARMINTGRLCMPAIYPPSPLAHPASPHAGCALPNVVLDRRAQRSLHQLLGPWFTALVFGDPVPDIPEPAADDALLRRVTVGAHCDAEGREALRRQLGVEMNGEVWLIRPDQHVMAAVDAAASGQAGAALPDWIAAALYPCAHPRPRTRTPHRMPEPTPMPLSQPQLDDLLERLIALTSAPDPSVQRDRLAQLVLLLIEALGDGDRAQAAVDEMMAAHAEPSCLSIP